MANINKTHIENELLAGNLELAIKMMLAILKAHDSRDYNDMILQSAAFNSLQKEKRSGLISDNNAKMNTSRITHTVRHYWSKIKPEWKIDFPGYEPTGQAAPPEPEIATSPVKNNETPDQKVVLFLSANPVSTKRLSVGVEMREIQESFNQSRGRDTFALKRVEAATLTSLRRALLEENPHILHFSGHASERGRIMLHDEQDGHVEVPEIALGMFLATLKEFGLPLECVVLNACYSDKLGEEIAKSVDYVVGMRDKVSDRSAIGFSTSFYETLASGRSYRAAFKLAKTNLAMTGVGGEYLPVLRTANHLAD